jgi:carbonic anhydrase
MVPSLLRIDNYEVIESVNKLQSKPTSMHSKKQPQKIEVNMIYNSVEKPQTTYVRTECEH